jgi:hypothetical protein
MKRMLSQALELHQETAMGNDSAGKLPAGCPSNYFPWPQAATRRDLLKVGSLGVSAAVLPGLAGLASQALAGKDESSGRTATAKSVIFLWMAGGMTHIDSFDPKPNAPEEVRGTLSAIQTRLPGVCFGEVMPNLAAIADKLSIVRSYSHDNNDHFMSQAYALSGRKVPATQILTEPNIGSLVSYLHGPRNELPGYIAVPGITRPGPPPHNLFVGGWLGGQYGPFAVGGEPEQPDFTAGEKSLDPPGEYNEDLKPRALDLASGLDIDRLSRRSQLRSTLDHLAKEERTAERAAALDGHYDSAFHLLMSPQVRHAFDLSQETEAVRAAYGRTKIGGRSLMARRLIEAGARFVMVDYGYDNDYGNLWDNHNAPVQFHPHISEMARRPYHLAGIDKAFASLISDLDDRGLLDSTLVVLMTEFGRTPKINPLGGRDHWGPAGSIFFAGGGAGRGQVIGATDAQAAFPTTRPYSPADVAATIYRAIGIEPSARVHDLNGRPMFVLPEGEAIPGLLA